MSSKKQDEYLNILFYSVHPEDKISQQIIEQLKKNPTLFQQFYPICVNDPNIVIPDQIKQLNQIPVLIASGFDQPISGQSALSWIQNHGSSDQQGPVSLDSSSNNYAYLSDEHQTNDYHGDHNKDYNLGFVGHNDDLLSKQFAPLTEDTNIVTYDNNQPKTHKDQMNQKLEQLRRDRDNEIQAKPQGLNPSRIHQSPPSKPFDQQGRTSFLNGNRPGNGLGLTYNPNIHSNVFAQPARAQLPFSMTRKLPTRHQTRTDQARPSLPFNMSQPAPIRFGRSTRQTPSYL